jgi:hypothetical protein
MIAFCYVFDSIIFASEVAKVKRSHGPSRDLRVREHVGQGEIRVADREVTAFVVVAADGVATGWAEQSCS